jgi:hypothetical protein
VEFLQLTRGSHFLDFVASRKKELSLQHGQVEVDLSRTLDVVGFDGFSEEVVNSAFYKFLVSKLEGHGGIALGLADTPLDVVYTKSILINGLPGMNGSFSAL